MTASTTATATATATATTTTMAWRPGFYEDAVAAPWGTAEASDTVFDRSCELNVE